MLHLAGMIICRDNAATEGIGRGYSVGIPCDHLAPTTPLEMLHIADVTYFHVFFCLHKQVHVNCRFDLRCCSTPLYHVPSDKLAGHSAHRSLLSKDPCDLQIAEADSPHLFRNCQQSY